MKKMNPSARFSALALSLPLMGLSLVGRAATYDLAQSFSTNSNPNGAWSYGYSSKLGGGLTLYADTSGSTNSILSWRNNLNLDVPGIYYNGGLTHATFGGGTPDILPGEVVSHPGPQGIYSVCRFVPPAPGSYQVQASFGGADRQGTTTDVHVLLNDVPLWDGVVHGFGPGTGVGVVTNLTLQATDRVDFAVGDGGNGYFYDATAVQATLVSPPPLGSQPSSFVYDDFAHSARLRFNGSAAQADPGVVTLTRQAIQSGSVFTAQPVTLSPNGGFASYFTFVSSPGNALAFVLQSSGPTALGTLSSAGTAGLANSLSVKFAALAQPPLTAQISLGLGADGSDALPVRLPGADFGNGQLWYAWVDYDGVSQYLSVRVSSRAVRPAAPVLSALVNFTGQLGGASAFAGFTGGSTAPGNQEIHAWKFLALPSSRLTGHYVLTNSPAFLLTNGFAFKSYVYQVGQATLTNFYALAEIFTTQPDGSLSFETAAASMPGVNPSQVMERDESFARDDSLELVNLMSAYSDGDQSGVALPLSAPVPPSQTFSQTYPGVDESQIQSLLGTLGGLSPQLPAAPTDPAQAVGLDASVQQQLDQRANLTDQLNQALQNDYQIQLDVLNNVWSFSGATNRGTMLLRQQQIEAPPNPPAWWAPRLGNPGLVLGLSTLPNQPYSIWSSPSLIAGSWRLYTSLVGDGYGHLFVVPTSNPRTFYQVTSP